MGSQPLKKLVKMEGAVVNLQQAASIPRSMVSQPPENLAAVGDTIALIPSDGMKRWGASSIGVQSESLICMVLSHRV